GDPARADAGVDQLALGALARIDQHPLRVPAQEVAVVVAGARRGLARRAQHHQVSTAHPHSLAARPVPGCRAYPRPMRSVLRTHEVTNQPPPLVGHDVFGADRALVEALEREGAGWAAAELAELGRRA